MAQRFVSRLLAGAVLLLPIVVSAAAPQDFRPPQKREAQAPPPKRPNLSITMPEAGDQLARLQFSSDSNRIDAKAQRVEVTYTVAGLTVEMASGVYTHNHYVSPWMSKSEGDFKTLSLTFGTNGELVSVRID